MTSFIRVDDADGDDDRHAWEAEDEEDEPAVLELSRDDAA